MVRKPVHEPIRELHIHYIYMAKEEPDCPPKAWRNGRWRNLARFGDHRVVVDQFVLRAWKLEDLGKHSIYRKIFRLPGRSVSRNIAQLVEGRRPLDKSLRCPKAVHVDEILGRRNPIKIQYVDSVNKGIAYKNCGDICRLRYSLSSISIVLRQSRTLVLPPHPGPRTGRNTSPGTMISGPG